MGQVDGKIALVTSGGPGIGRATAPAPAAEDDSSYMTGHDIAVDGGFTDLDGFGRVLKQVMAQSGR